MKKFICIIIGSAAFTFLHAQDSLRTNQLDEVIVTATKYVKKASETGKVVTVITREQLDESQGKDLAQLLNEQAGISVTGANSNPGKDKSIYLRGAKQEYTLITIDGVPVSDASITGGYFDFRHIPIDIIDRIEILKGSQSTLYGSDAIAGVINIITKKKSDKAVSPFIMADYGSYNTRKLNAGISGNTKILSYNISYTHNNSEGISEATDAENTGKFDNDDYEQNALFINTGIKVSDKVKLSPYLRYSKYNAALDGGAFVDDKDYTSALKNMQTGLRNEFMVGKTRLNVLYSYTYTTRDYLNDSLIKETPLDGYSKGFYKAHEHFADAYVNVPLAKTLTLTAGADYRNSNTDIHTMDIYKFYSGSDILLSQYESTISKDSASQNQIGVYGELNYSGKKGFDAAIGGRFNHLSVYGNNGVFNINPSYLIHKQVKVFANISSAYKVPTLYQLYSEYRNPYKALKPEKAYTYEGGFQYYSKNNFFTARVAVFKRDIKDVITFYTDAATYKSYYINQDEQHDYGFEIEPTFSIKNKVKLILSYAYANGEIGTKANAKDTSYFNLYRRPKSIFNATANYHVNKKLFISATVQSTGERTDIDFRTYPSSLVELKPYTLLNFYAFYNISSNLKVFADLKNITNVSYAELLGYNTLGRNITAGIAWHL
ncbi:MAG: TonB-dependent receptor plug domain-containing protein [Ilyomonas sp.]